MAVTVAPQIYLKDIFCMLNFEAEFLGQQKFYEKIANELLFCFLSLCLSVENKASLCFTTLSI